MRELVAKPNNSKDIDDIISEELEDLPRHMLGLGIQSSKELMANFGFANFMTAIVSVAVRLGGRRILKTYGLTSEELHTAYKADAGYTPQTVTDIESGKIVKKLIRREFPTHAICEEEEGFLQGNQFVWIVDPLDGTSCFVRGQRSSTIGVAVYDMNSIPITASICNPFERELLIAEKGHGAYLFPLYEDLAISSPPIKLKVSSRSSLEDATVYIEALFNEQTRSRKLKLLDILTTLANEKNLNVRMSGSGINQQEQVAAGRGDLTFTDAVGGPWDLKIGAFILEEAGGIMVNGQTGEPVTTDTTNVQVALGGAKALVELILPFVQSCYTDYKGFK